jgi:hypothetical protein
MTQLEYLGDWNKWQVYKNSDGFLEGYKSSNKKINLYKDAKGNQIKQSVDSQRIITNAKDMAGFIKFVNGMRPQKPKSLLPPPQQPKLFEDDDEL